MTNAEVSRRIKAVIKSYLSAANQDCPDLGPSTKLVRDTALSSDDGVNLVLDLCTEFGIMLPDDFNAIVHDDGKRDRTLAELVTYIQDCVNLEEQTK
jgi:acyl carrier protein